MALHYRWIRKLGSGGMASVLLARAEGQGFSKLVAYKRLAAVLSDDPEARQLFERELSMAPRFDHPHVVQVLDGGLTPEPFLAMEWVDGASLQGLLKAMRPGKARLPPDAVAFIGSAICQALGHLLSVRGDDGRAIFEAHRDISPANVLISRAGAVKLADFGVSRAAGTAQTASGLVRGKWEYFPPEVSSGIQDIRGDLYALGVVLYELCTLKHPFEASTPQAHWHRAVAEPLTRHADIPPALWAVIDQALAKAPAQRFAHPEQMATALDAFLLSSGRTMNAGQLARAVAPLMPPPLSLEPDPAVVNAQAAVTAAQGARPPTSPTAPVTAVPSPSRPAGPSIPRLGDAAFAMASTEGWTPQGPQMDASGRLDDAHVGATGDASLSAPKRESGNGMEMQNSLAESMVESVLHSGVSGDLGGNGSGLELARPVPRSAHETGAEPRFLDGNGAPPPPTWEPPRKGGRRTALALGAVAALGLGGGAFWMLRGRSAAGGADSASAALPLVRIDSTPAGEVFSGEVSLGPTPLVLPNDYPAGQNVGLTIRAHGYATASVFFRGGQPAALNVKLVKR